MVSLLGWRWRPARHTTVILYGMTSITGRVDVGGVAEVAAVLGVSRQQVHLRQRLVFPRRWRSCRSGRCGILRSCAAGPEAACAGRRGWPAQGAAAVVAGRWFVLGQQIGRGGFADVYRAADLMAAQGGEVAVKVLRADTSLDAATIGRFEGNWP